VSNLADFEARLVRLAAGGLRRVIVREARATAIEIEAKAKLNVREVLHRRTGRLIQSINSTVEEQDSRTAIIASAGGNTGKGVVRYARMQEQGGRQTPKNGKYLRVPVQGGPALTAAGVDRFPGPLRTTAPPGFFRLIKTAQGKLFLVHDKKDRSEIWYQLLRSVNIPSRPYLKPAVEYGAERLRARLSSAVRQAVFGATT
jgi:hypothetical protein